MVWLSLQGPSAQVEQNFTVLQEDEAPTPGMVFGIDAEFVALSRPDKVLQGCAFVSPCNLCDSMLPAAAHRAACILSASLAQS